MPWLYPVALALICWYAFAALDVIGNYTVFMVFGMPPYGAHTISQRLAVYRVKETGFKQFTAVVLCDLLSELDPTGAHC